MILTIKKVIIMPFICSHLNIPDKLEDSDGGTLHWISPEQANDLFMPQGYKDTISGVIPESSCSNFNNFKSVKPFFKIIPDYKIQVVTELLNFNPAN